MSFYWSKTENNPLVKAKINNEHTNHLTNNLGNTFYFYMPEIPQTIIRNKLYNQSADTFQLKKLLWCHLINVRGISQWSRQSKIKICEGQWASLIFSISENRKLENKFQALIKRSQENWQIRKKQVAHSSLGLETKYARLHKISE